jgi:hypothetical protein
MADALLDEFKAIGQAALPHAVVAAIWSTRVQQHLVRHVPRWGEILADAKQSGQGHLTVYGMRHGFAFRGSQLYGLSPRVLAALMGHHSCSSVALRAVGWRSGDCCRGTHCKAASRAGLIFGRGGNRSDKEATPRTQGGRVIYRLVGTSSDKQIATTDQCVPTQIDGKVGNRIAVEIGFQHGTSGTKFTSDTGEG